MLLLRKSEPASLYVRYYDVKCKEYYCFRHAIVDTSWAPDPGRGPRAPTAGASCHERCKPVDCCVVVVSQDCSQPNCRPVRKEVNPWSQPFYSHAWLERQYNYKSEATVWVRPQLD